MQPGDLLVCFTDGISEPENEAYGEMFGEDQAGRSGGAQRASRPEIRLSMEQVLASVHQWTASEELQDDMTLLIARRV